MNHIWKKTCAFIYCAVCLIIRDSDSEDSSDCPGKTFEEKPKFEKMRRN